MPAIRTHRRIRSPTSADHSLANSSIWYAVLAALVLVAAFRWRRHIGNRAAAGAAVVSVLFPPWIIPGAGVVVLAIVRCVARHRERGARAIADHPANQTIVALPS